MKILSQILCDVGKAILRGNFFALNKIEKEKCKSSELSIHLRNLRGRKHGAK